MTPSLLLKSQSGLHTPQDPCSSRQVCYHGFQAPAAPVLTRANRILKMWWNIWLICVLVFILYCLYYLIDIMYVHKYKYNTILNWLQERYAWCIHCFWRDVKKTLEILFIFLYILYYIIIYLCTVLFSTSEQTNGTWRTWDMRKSPFRDPSFSAWNNLNSAVRFSPRVTSADQKSRRFPDLLRLLRLLRPMLEITRRCNKRRTCTKELCFSTFQNLTFSKNFFMCLLSIPILYTQGQDKTQARLRSMVLSTRTSLRCTSRSPVTCVTLCPSLGLRNSVFCWFSVSFGILMMACSWNFVVLKVWCCFNDSLWSFVAIGNWTYDSGNSSNWMEVLMGQMTQMNGLFSIFSCVELPEGT